MKKVGKFLKTVKSRSKKKSESQKRNNVKVKIAFFRRPTKTKSFVGT